MKRKFDFWLFGDIVDHLIILALAFLFILGAILAPDLKICLAAAFGGLAWVMELVCVYTVGLKFDKKFEKILRTPPYPTYSLLIPGSLFVNLRNGRALIYVRNIILPGNSRKKKTMLHWFNGYDFRKNCTLLELFFVYTFAVSFVLMFAVLLIPKLLSL